MQCFPFVQLDLRASTRYEGNYDFLEELMTTLL